MTETTQTTGMGSTGKVQLDGELRKAMAACTAYRNSVQAIVQRMQQEYATLQGGFQGKAAQGFDTFYKTVIEYFFQQGSTFDKYMKMYDDENEGLFISIEKTFVGEPSGIDPNLGEQNNKMATGNAGTSQSSSSVE